MSNLTIPSECLRWLPPVVDDPPFVVWDGGGGFAATGLSAVPGRFNRIIFPQSAACLLRILARAVAGTCYDWPIWWYRDDSYGYEPGWCIEVDGDAHVVDCQTTTPEMDPMVALAHAVCWVARVRRAGQLGWVHDQQGMVYVRGAYQLPTGATVMEDRVLSDTQAEALAVVEVYLNLPPLEPSYV